MGDKQIVCIKWGTLYGAEYVNRLYGMVARNITGPFNFYCLTDDDLGIRSEVMCKPLPELGTTLPTYAAHIWGKPERASTFGVWDKVRLWNPNFTGISGEVLFLDLDVVITGALDQFFEFDSDERVVMARSETKLLRKAGQSSIYRFRVGQLSSLYDEFRADAQKVVETWKLEQDFLNDRAPGGIAYWPKRWVRNFRVSCIPPFPINYFKAPSIPNNARVILFPGRLNPPDAVVGRWSDADTPRTPLAHLAAGLRAERREGLWPHLRHYLRPTPWITDRWRDQ